MYPTLCSYRSDLEGDETDFAALTAPNALGPSRPGLALSEHGDRVEVLIAPNGRTISVPRDAIRPGLPELVALAMMDAVEEAIEDARDQSPDGAPLIARLETTLGLLERALDA
jgi:hypothetical protein